MEPIELLKAYEHLVADDERIKETHRANWEQEQAQRYFSNLPRKARRMVEIGRMNVIIDTSAYKPPTDAELTTLRDLFNARIQDLRRKLNQDIYGQQPTAE